MTLKCPLQRPTNTTLPAFDVKILKLKSATPHGAVSTAYLVYLRMEDILKHPQTLMVYHHFPHT